MTTASASGAKLLGNDTGFRLLVETIKDYAIFLLDPDGNVVSWNPGAERFKGYRAEEIIGQHFSRFYPQEALERGLPADELRIAARTGRYEDEGWRVKKDGTQFWASVVITTLRDDDGVLVGFGKVTRDLTERMRFEQSLQKSDRMKSEFLANMSHELRTPLNGIIGFSEFLIDEKPGPLEPKQKEYIGDVLNSARHLLQLINDVLDLSKIEAGKMELHPETFAAAKALAEVSAVVKGIAHERHIEIKVEVGEGIETVTLDQNKFKQVLYNLLSNAVKFTNEGGEVHICARRLDPDRFEIQVRDTGIGIKAEDIPRLFIEFVQLDSQAARRSTGTGLGLALTKKIVEAQGGRISVESQPGSGSLFTVNLPVVQGDRKAA